MRDVILTLTAIGLSVVYGAGQVLVFSLLVLVTVPSDRGATPQEHQLAAALVMLVLWNIVAVLVTVAWIKRRLLHA